MIHERDAFETRRFRRQRALRNRVVVALESRFGENAASIFDAGSGDLLGGGAAENGAWSTLLPVRFLIPVLSETYLPATIVLTGTQSIQVEDPTGQNAEALS